MLGAIVAISLLSAAPGLARGCACTGSNAGVDAARFGADYGIRCAAWEDGVASPANTESCSSLPAAGVGPWCCRAWCYIDPATCNGVTTPYFASHVQGLSTEHPTLFYSYAACDAESERAHYVNTAAETAGEATADPADTPARASPSGSGASGNIIGTGDSTASGTGGTSGGPNAPVPPPPPGPDATTCPFQGVEAYSPDVTLSVTIRNFDDSGPGAHPHFGCHRCLSPQGGGGLFKNMVEDRLSPEGKPVLAAEFGADSAAAFSRWYAKETCAFSADLPFKFDAAKGLHVYDSHASPSCERESRDPACNYLPPGVGAGLFTTEFHIFFRYNGGEVFDFRGDDDVWVFVNDKLVMDLGGCHTAKPGSVSLDAVAADAGLVVGKNYELALFQAERCYGHSNFKAEMTLRQDQGVYVNQCSLTEERGYCDKDEGRCVCVDGWSGPDCSTPPNGSANTAGITTQQQQQCPNFASSTGSNSNSNMLALGGIALFHAVM